MAGDAWKSVGRLGLIAFLLALLIGEAVGDDYRRRPGRWSRGSWAYESAPDRKPGGACCGA